jgi:hypothetical protein
LIPAAEGALPGHPPPRPNRANVTGNTTGWKKALNALAMYYGERITEN